MLTGYRILDLTDEKGPLCSRILGDLGADVVKVEPPGGNRSRRMGPFYHDEPHPNKSLYFWSYNTNKRGVTLNLATSDGRALFKRLVAKADAVIESFMPLQLKAWGLGYHDLRAINPRLIMTSITPYGQSGPDAQYEDPDLVLMARGGLLYMSGETDGPPGRTRVPQSYNQAGAQAAMMTSLALYHRDVHGRGQHIDLSMQEAVANALISVQTHWDVLRVNERRGTSQVRGKVIGRYSWPCKDGYINWCWWVAPGWGQKNYPLLEWMTELGMQGDLWDQPWEEKSTADLKQAEVDHWEDVFGAFFKTQTKAEIYRQALKRRIMLFPTYEPSDVANYEQLRERNYWHEVEHPELGEKVTYPGAFVLTMANMWSLRRRPPLVGEHNREVFGDELGLTTEQLVSLKSAGVV